MTAVSRGLAADVQTYRDRSRQQCTWLLAILSRACVGGHSNASFIEQGCGRDCGVGFAASAARQDLRIWPLSPSYLGRAQAGFILGFGSAPIEDIPAAVRKLRKLLAMK